MESYGCVMTLLVLEFVFLQVAVEERGQREKQLRVYGP